MNRLFRFIIISSIALLCTSAVLFLSVDAASTLPPERSISPDRIVAVRDINFKKHFQDLKVDGSMLIYDAAGDRTYQYNPRRNETEFLPASTFKILNSLISLETKIVADERAVFTWDGIVRKLPEWNRDLNIKEAMKLSAVWFYQVLARRVGHEQMQKWVTLVGYGNSQIGGKEDIDKFWLEGKLRITPQSQMQFLRRLYNGTLPFSKRSQSIVKDMLIIEQTPDYTIRGKTGWVGFTEKIEPQIGWYIGYLEKDKNAYFFTTNIDIRSKTDPAARKELVRRYLHDLALL